MKLCLLSQRITSRCIFNATVVAFATTLTFISATPVRGQILEVQVGLSHSGDIVHATGSNYTNFASALGYQFQNSGGSITRGVLLDWSTVKDGGGEVTSWTTSQDGALTFPTASTPPPQINSNCSIKRRDGTIIALPFYTTRVNPAAAPAANYSFTFAFPSSNPPSVGTSWSYPASGMTNGTVNFGSQSVDSVAFHRGILEENDGSLYATAYATFTGDANSRAILLKSTDGGADWTFFSTIAYSSTRKYSETTVVRCANGDWLAVLRNDTTSTQPLLYIRSTNKGVTWNGPAAQLPGLGADPGVDPDLTLLPNGVLALAYGRQLSGSDGRQPRITYSVDGSGANWTNNGSAFSVVNNVHESTGYTTVVPVGTNRFVQFGDTGTSWSYSTPHPSPNPFTIWKNFGDVLVTNQINRIDLNTKLAQGTVAVTTDLNYVNGANPEARPSAAFDGSTEYWSGAFKAGTAGTFTVHLDRTYTLTDIGLCLQYNTPEAATVSYSTDGTNYTAAHVYSTATNNACTYFHFTTPVAASYVQVTVSGAGPYVSLNELELYAKTDTFENNELGVPPYQYDAGSQQATVVDGVGYNSSRALLLSDQDPSNPATIQRTVTSSTSKTLTFKLDAETIANGILIDILANTANPAYHLAVFPDGSIKYHNGTAWTTLSGGGAGTVPLGTYCTFSVAATVSPATAVISVNGVAKGSATMYTTGVTTLAGFRFGSGGSAPVGDTALFDDVDIN